MKKASEHKPLSQFSLLLQGQPKSGKTTLALAFPKPYILDCDNNLEGTLRLMRAKKIEPNFLYDVPDIDDKGLERPVDQRYIYASKCLAEAAVSPEVETIIVDGVSKMNAYIMAEIGRQQARKPGEMQLQDWGAHQYMWQNFVTKLQATPKLFILLAHEEFSDVPQLAGHILINIPGKKIQQSLPGMFSDVWRCEVESSLQTVNGKPTTVNTRLVRASAKTGLSLGNSLGLPDVFPADFNIIKTALSK